MKAVIMAGGMGTRIQSVRADIPKPMIEICGKPILRYQIENLRVCGITDITLVTGHLGDVIREYFGDGDGFGVRISYFEERTPLGTAGALVKMLPENADTSCCPAVLDGDFLLLCGDVIFDIDFSRFISFHRSKDAYASLMAHPNGHPYDSSLLVTEILPPQVPGENPVETSRVTEWLSKEDARGGCRNLVNAGIEIVSPELLRLAMRNFVPRHPESPDKIDLDRDILKPGISTGRIFAYRTPEYIKDMGTPDRYYETEADVKSGKVRARNLSRKQRAVFLDRDGTINRKNGFITSPDQFMLIDGAAAAIRKINRSGYLAVVITNQPVIARGECTFGELEEIHGKMESELGKEGAYVDAVYFCPHHPDRGFPGERAEYKTECDCRKPKPGLILRAAADLNIDLSLSFMVGDSRNDVLAGENAGCGRSVQLEDGYTLADFVSEYLDGSPHGITAPEAAS
mgnify:FL=1